MLTRHGLSLRPIAWAPSSPVSVTVRVYVGLSLAWWLLEVSGMAARRGWW